MRDLTNIELQTASGALRPAPVKPRLPKTILGVRLGRGDQRLLAALFTILASPPQK
jgi:hypothetical protein